MLLHLFQGGRTRLPCGDGTAREPGNVALLDATGDDRLDLSDAISCFQWIFTGGRTPANCGGPGCEDCIDVPDCASECAAF